MLATPGGTPDWRMWLIAAASGYGILLTKLNPLWMLAAGGLAGGLLLGVGGPGGGCRPRAGGDPVNDWRDGCERKGFSDPKLGPRLRGDDFFRASPEVTTASPQSFAALRHPGFRVYFVGAALAMMADNIEHVISYWVMFQKFHSPALAGFAVISHWVPFLLFSVYVGRARRPVRPPPHHPARHGCCSCACRSAGAFCSSTDTLQMWHAAALLVIHGFAGVLWSPPAQLLLHDIVGAAGAARARSGSTRRRAASACCSGRRSAARCCSLLGPCLGIFVQRR